MTCGLGSRPPIVSAVLVSSTNGILAPNGLVGWNGGCTVLTAKSPQARPAIVVVCPHACVSAPSTTVVVGWYSGYDELGKPLVSSTEWVPAANGGAAAATRYWWLRNDPPNAAWKNWSSTT